VRVRVPPPADQKIARSISLLYLGNDEDAEKKLDVVRRGIPGSYIGAQRRPLRTSDMTLASMHGFDFVSGHLH
jgi:hypothetical protein